MLRVALTGGIATGKSYVLARLKDRGVATIDADEIVHDVLGPGTPTSAALAAQFGREFLKPDGSVDRARLGAKVFKEPNTRHQIEAIVHPLVYHAIRTWSENLDEPMAVAGIPLLYETGHEKDFDVVVVTVCPPDVQLQRLLERDGMSEEEARQRIAAQMPAEEKAARGDFVIRTGGPKADTDRQVDELLDKLRKAS
ncbi:MAG TPA: dephospho-CoA kinase [Vicinamibacterales bacterium]|nr:dephospho-CoA kinase [Vicinamibacterales bacterium]